MTRKKNKLVFGVGINDADHPIYVNGQHIKSYRAWVNMLHRVYDPKFHATHPTYIGCSVFPDWLYFSNFEKWFDANYVEGCDLDKDLLDPNNKIYCPEKCLFVTSRINSLVIDCGSSRGEYPVGVYYQKSHMKFKAQICDGSGKRKYLGLFSTPEAAHLAWLKAKRQIVLELKPELDQIDSRLFDAIMSRYPLPEPANDPLHFLQEAA